MHALLSKLYGLLSDRLESMAAVLRDPLVRGIITAGAGATVMTVAAVGWFTQADRFVMGFAPTQPIPYSHRLHAGAMLIPCLYCHSGAEKARQAGVPAVEVCMNCHRVTKTDSPPIRELASIYASNAALDWRRIHALPDYVFFDHRPHVRAGVACQTCHGPVEQMDVIGQRMSLRMGHCLACHRSPAQALPRDTKIQRAPEDCYACHR
jgi:hypothetical protein